MGWSARPHMNRPLRLIGAAVLVLVLTGLLGGCGRGTFVGRQYDDFTAYYNTFYNAQAAFEKGLESVDQSSPDVNRNQYVSIFPQPQSESGGGAFEDVIQKSANLLREHPNSKWVDDALILIGRSYYYQQNYVGAAQKFREVIALNAEREGEARFRLAKTLLATERYADVSEALTSALESGEEYGTWTARMHLVRGELLVRQEQWEDAEVSLEQGLEGSLPDEVGARAALLLGQVRETRGDYEEARIAYQQVPEYNPRYPLEFAARLSAIEMQGRQGEPDAALQRLESLERGDDTNEMRGRMAIVRARLYRMQDQPDRARQVLLDMLRGDEAPTGATQGGLHYELGILYRNAYEDFTQAAAHFDTAATTLSSQAGSGTSGSDREVQELPRAPSDAQAQADRFQGLAKRAQTVSRVDSLLRLGRMAPDEFQSYVEKVRQRRLAERKAQAETQGQGQQQFRSQGSTQRDASSQSQSAAVETRGSDAGFLFHRDPTLVQQGQRQFRQTWGGRPRVDNWRRLSDIQGGGATATTSGEGGGEAVPGASGSGQASEALVDVSAVPRDSASQAEMEDRRAVAQYELGNALFRAANRPDSAETWYRKVLTENEDHPVARQALYALAQSHRAQGDSALARKTYRRVIEDYSGTLIARRAREQLGLAREESSAKVAASKADSAYARAYEAWRVQGAHGSALDAFLEVAQTYPETDAAPKALLAAGVVYHQIIQRDSTSAPRWKLGWGLDQIIQSDSSAGASAGRTRTPTRDTTSVDSTALLQNVNPSADSTRGDSTTESQEPVPRMPPEERDSTQVPRRPELGPDSTSVSPDSAQAPPPDSVGRRTSPSTAQRLTADSVASDTSTRPTHSSNPMGDGSVAPDSLLVADSTLVLFADTTVLLDPWSSADTTVPSVYLWPDSTWSGPAVVDPTVPLRRLLSYLTKRYPDASEAKRAQLLLDRLKSSATEDSAEAPTPARTPSASDSTTVLPRDSTAAPDTTVSDTAVVADTTRASRRRSPDSTQADTTRRGREAPRPTPPRDSTGQPLPDSVASPSISDSTGTPPDSASGPWTLLVETFGTEGAAARRRQVAQEQLSGGWSVTVFADSTGSPPRHRVIIGTFRSKSDAERAKAELSESIANELSVWALPPQGTPRE